LWAIAFFGVVTELPFGTLGLLFYGLVSWGFFDTSNAFINERTKGSTTGIAASF
jgi:hypothetical protein